LSDWRLRQGGGAGFAGGQVDWQGVGTGLAGEAQAVAHAEVVVCVVHEAGEAGGYVVSGEL